MQKLIEALQSGQYEQNFGALRSEDKFCCLGLACELYRLIHPDEYSWKSYKGSFTLIDSYLPAFSYTGRMPLKVAKYWGINNTVGLFQTPEKYQIPAGHSTLVYLNDTLKWSFKKIGNFLKTNPEFGTRGY